MLVDRPSWEGEKDLFEWLSLRIAHHRRIRNQVSGDPKKQ